MRRTAWILAAACLLALAPDASAQPAPPAAAADPEVYYPAARVNVFADLTFTRGPGASICPEAWLFRYMIAARVSGSDPFTPDPRGVYVGRVSLTLSRTGDGFASSLTWENTEGKTYTSPRYRHHGGATYLACKEALEYAVVDLSSKFLLLAMELGERYARKTRPPYGPAPEPAPRPAVEACPPASRFDLWPRELPLAPLPKPAPDPPKAPDRWPLAVRLGLGFGPELVAAGWGSLGFSAELGVRYRAFSVGVAAHGDPALGSLPIPGGSVSFARVTGDFLLCAHFGWFAGCGIGEAGRILFPNHVAALPPSALYGAAGVRAGLDFPIAPPRLFFHTAVDVLAPIHPASYAPFGPTVFQVAGPNLGLGLGLLLELSP